MDGLPIADALPVSFGDAPSERILALFEAHHQRLYRLARRLTQHSDDARDLVQETFLRAARAPGAVPVGCIGEEAWLVRVLVNIRRDQWRQAATRERHDQEIRRSPTLERDQEAALVAHSTVWGALDRLGPRRRAVLIMYELEGLSAAAIAALLGISAITVRWHLSRGRHDLARVLRPEMEKP